MKKLKYSIVSLLALQCVSFAGPGVPSLTDYDAQDLKKAEAVIKKVEPENVREKVSEESTAMKKGVSIKPPSVKETAEIEPKFKEESKGADFGVVKRSKPYKKGFGGGKDEKSFGFDRGVEKIEKKEAVAYPKFYIGLALAAIGSDSDTTATIFTNSSTQDRQIGFMARLGYNAFEYLSAEIRGTYGIVNEAEGTKFKNIAFYLKPKYELNDDLVLYALAGYGSSNLQGDLVNGAGISYGFGVKYMAFENFGICVDLVNYLAKEDSNSMWGLNIGIEAEF